MNNNILSHFLSHPFFSILLKNDVQLYGQCVREILIRQTPINTYLKKFKIIHAISDSVYKSIVERDLHQFIIKRDRQIINNSVNSYKSYELCIDDTLPNINLIVQYIISINNYNIIKYLKIFVDVNLLSISRTGLTLLFVPEIYKTHPIPLFAIIQNITKKQFMIIEDYGIINDKNIEIISTFLKQEWTNIINSIEYNCITKIKNINEDKCGICLDLQATSEVLELSCGHIFHEICWENNVKNFIKQKKYNNNGILCCPFCREKFMLWEIVSVKTFL